MSKAREDILLSTCSLLEKQGYHGTGLNEIIKLSGAPKGSLYYYFPHGKEQITSEAVLQSGRATSERIRAGLAENNDAAQAIHDFVLKVADAVEASGFAAGGPLATVAMETATESDRINLACREAYGMLQGAFHDKLVECGFEEDQADEMATFTLACVEGGIILSRTYHTADPLRRVAKQLGSLLAG